MVGWDGGGGKVQAELRSRKKVEMTQLAVHTTKTARWDAPSVTVGRGRDALLRFAALGGAKNAW